MWVDRIDKITVVEKNSGLIIQIDGRENYIRVCEPYEVFVMPEQQELRRIIKDFKC